MGYVHYGERRVCPVCRKEITGRTDKIYCSAECRVYANNEKRRVPRSDTLAGITASIDEDIAAMYNRGGKWLVKIILLVTRLCKIMHKFGR